MYTVVTMHWTSDQPAYIRGIQNCYHHSGTTVSRARLQSGNYSVVKIVSNPDPVQRGKGDQVNIARNFLWNLSSACELINSQSSHCVYMLPGIPYHKPHALLITPLQTSLSYYSMSFWQIHINSSLRCKHCQMLWSFANNHYVNVQVYMII